MDMTAEDMDVLCSCTAVTGLLSYQLDSTDPTAVMCRGQCYDLIRVYSDFETNEDSSSYCDSGEPAMMS